LLLGNDVALSLDRSPHVSADRFDAETDRMLLAPSTLLGSRTQTKPARSHVRRGVAILASREKIHPREGQQSVGDSYLDAIGPVAGKRHHAAALVDPGLEYRRFIVRDLPGRHVLEENDVHVPEEV